MSNETEAEDAANEADAAADEEESGLQAGDFIELDYTARTAEDGDLVDTTDPEVAEEEGVADEGEFEPRIIVLGEGHLFEAVEEDIYGKEPGDTGNVVVSAEEAFGEYDDTQVRTISKDKIPEDDRYPGAQVQIEGDQGFLETIIGGRARVDFNHPLAGEAVEYDYEIVREVDDREERASGVIEMFLDMELDVWFQTDTVEEEQLVEPDADDDADDGDDDEPPEPETETVEVEKETLYIEATPQLTMNQQWMMGKTQIAQQLTQLLDVDRVIVQEELGGGGMGGMMGGMGGMMGGGGDGGVDIEAELETEEGETIEADTELETADAEELADELDE